MEYKLEGVFDLQMGKTPSRDRADYWNTNDFKWISIADLTKSDKFISETKEYLSDVAVKESGISLIPSGTVIMSFKLSIGKAAITTEPMYSNEAIMAFKDKHVIQLLPDYVYYMLTGKNWDECANKAVKGKTLNKATLSKIKVNIHDLPKQREIVAVLDKTKSLIDKRNRELKQLDNLIKARFVELFGDPRSNPYGFGKKMLKDTCKVVTGNTPSRGVEDYYGDYVEWIKTDNIVSGLLNPTMAAECLSEEGMKVGRIVEKDSILMACIAGSIASIGRVCVTDRTVAFNQQINAVVPEEYNILFLYVMLQLSKEYLVEEINMALKGILSKSKLEEKEFIVPPMELQEQFADFVKQVDKSKVVVPSKIKNAIFAIMLSVSFGQITSI